MRHLPGSAAGLAHSTQAKATKPGKLDWLIRSTWWGPLVTVAAALGVWINRASMPWTLADGLAVVIALALWPGLEAMVHKYLLHSRGLFSENHAIHHTEATVVNGLTPAIVGVGFGFAGWLLSSFPIASTVYSTYLACYLVYELVHMLVHCGVRIPVLSEHHLEHHHRPGTNYGVTTPWNRI